MTSEGKMEQLEKAVEALYAELAVSRKREEEAAKFCEDLQTRWERLGKEGLPGPRSTEGIGLGKRGGSLVAHFDGDLQQYPNFRADVVFALRLLRKDFRDEEEKVGFIITHLHGEARSWLRNLWRDNDPALQNADAFIKAMDACFQSTTDVDVARKEMHGLRQGKATVRQYHARFFALVNTLRWEKDSVVVRDLFWEGLNASVKDELARGDRPSTTAEVVQRALTIGVRMEERPWNRDEGRLARTPAKAPPFMPRESGRAHSTPPLGEGVEPMELGVAKAQTAARALTPGAVKPKNPRGNRKCFLCDSAQHMVKECPQRIQKHTAASAIIKGGIQQEGEQQGNDQAWLEAEALGPSQARF